MNGAGMVFILEELKLCNGVSSAHKDFSSISGSVSFVGRMVDRMMVDAFGSVGENNTLQRYVNYAAKGASSHSGAGRGISTSLSYPGPSTAGHPAPIEKETTPAYLRFVLRCFLLSMVFKRRASYSCSSALSHWLPSNDQFSSRINQISSRGLFEPKHYSSEKFYYKSRQFLLSIVGSCQLKQPRIHETKPQELIIALPSNRTLSLSSPFLHYRQVDGNLLDPIPGHVTLCLRAP